MSWRINIALVTSEVGVMLNGELLVAIAMLSLSASSASAPLPIKTAFTCRRLCRLNIESLDRAGIQLLQVLAAQVTRHTCDHGDFLRLPYLREPSSCVQKDGNPEANMLNIGRRTDSDSAHNATLGNRSVSSGDLYVTVLCQRFIENVPL